MRYAGIDRDRIVGNPGTPCRLLFDTGSRVYRICAWPDTQSGAPGDVAPTGGPQGPHHVTQRGNRPPTGRGDVPGAVGRDARPQPASRQARPSTEGKQIVWCPLIHL
jgi:hypothetical protein